MDNDGTHCRNLHRIDTSAKRRGRRLTRSAFLVRVRCEDCQPGVGVDVSLLAFVAGISMQFFDRHGIALECSLSFRSIERARRHSSGRCVSTDAERPYPNRGHRFRILSLFFIRRTKKSAGSFSLLRKTAAPRTAGDDAPTAGSGRYHVREMIYEGTTTALACDQYAIRCADVADASLDHRSVPQA